VLTVAARGFTPPNQKHEPVGRANRGGDAHIPSGIRFDLAKVDSCLGAASFELFTELQRCASVPPGMGDVDRHTSYQLNCTPLRGGAVVNGDAS